MKNQLLTYYLNLLDYSEMPEFLLKYLRTPSMSRLKDISYFCGMDYASSNVYQFSEYISRYDHSLTVALLTYKFTKDKKATIAGLVHDIATPCFSHVIDYMNKDYEKQESTEEYTEEILRRDMFLQQCLSADGLTLDDIIDFKKYSIVDNDRPKLCADRLDGIILTGIGWTKNVDSYDISSILDDLCVFKNEDGEDELGFKSRDVALKVLAVSDNIDSFCHSNEDTYMMELLAVITKLAIDNGYISYNNLYYLTERELFDIFRNSNDRKLIGYLYKFQRIKLKDIPIIDIPNVKVRTLNPLVNGKRLK